MQDEAALAIWALATNHQGNKDTITKLGGIEPLLGLLVTGTTARSQEYVAGALTALASKHSDNRQVISKRLVGLLGSTVLRSTTNGPDRAERVLKTCAAFMSDSAANQTAIAKLGGIPNLLAWLVKDPIPNLMPSAESKAAIERVQTQGAFAMLSLAMDNTTTQGLIRTSDGIAPLITLLHLRRSLSVAAQKHAACALWHLASQAETKAAIVESGAIKPLIVMLARAEDSPATDLANELAAIILLRLARSNELVCREVADKGGVPPLVALLSSPCLGAQQQAAALLSELSLVSHNRMVIAAAGGIIPATKLLSSTTLGSSEVAARLLAHLAYEDAEDQEGTAEAPAPAGSRARHAPGSSERSALNGAHAPAASPAAAPAAAISNVHRRSRTHAEVQPEGSSTAERRAVIEQYGGLQQLISMLSGSSSGMTVVEAVKGVLGKSFKEEAGIKVGLREQAAISLAEIANHDPAMQAAIIRAGGVPPLLLLIKLGSQLGQEHAARAIWHLAALTEMQMELVDCKAIPELVQLLKVGSPFAQEMAAAGLADIAHGCVLERQVRAAAAQAAARVVGGGGASGAPQKGASAAECMGTESEKSSDREGQSKEAMDRLLLIPEAGGIAPLVNILSTGTTQGRENAAAALWHLALETSNQGVMLALTHAPINALHPSSRSMRSRAHTCSPFTLLFLTLCFDRTRTRDAGHIASKRNPATRHGARRRD